MKVRFDSIHASGCLVVAMYHPLRLSGVVIDWLMIVMVMQGTGGKIWFMVSHLLSLIMQGPVNVSSLFSILITPQDRNWHPLDECNETFERLCY